MKDHFKTLRFPNLQRSTALLFVLLILSVASNAIQFLRYDNTHASFPTSTNTSTVTSSTSVPSSTATGTSTATDVATATPTGSNGGTLIATDKSRLIPLNQAPVLDDSLSNGNSGYQWDIGKQGGATCSFIQGSYQIQAPAGTGGGCGTNDWRSDGHGKRRRRGNCVQRCKSLATTITSLSSFLCTSSYSTLHIRP